MEAKPTKPTMEVNKQVKQPTGLSPTTTQKCPNCGAHLPPVGLAGTQQRAQPKKASAPPESEATKALLNKIKGLMCGPWRRTNRVLTIYPTMRPVFSDGDVVGALKDDRARKTLDQAARKIQAGVYATAKQLINSLSESRLCPTKPDLARSEKYVYEAVGAIIYAMEWTGAKLETDDDAIAAHTPAVPEFWFDPLNKRLLSRLLELMLVVDYGFPNFPITRRHITSSESLFRLRLSEFAAFSRLLVAVAWRWKQQQALPGIKEWDCIYSATLSWELGFGFKDVPIWDVATMIYYYETRRQPVVIEDQKQGWIGYTGVLEEMVAEVPTGQRRTPRRRGC